MHIAVIGTGNIGRTLGTAWGHVGHQVIFGTRDPDGAKAQAAVQAAANAAQAMPVTDAIAAAEVVVFAIPGATMAEALPRIGATLNGKIVIDATNQFDQSVVNAIAVIRAAAPEALIFRAFNSLGWENFAHSQVGGIQADMLYVGPNTDQRAVVNGLIADVGLNPIYVGDLAQAPLVDSLGLLWGALAFGQGHGRRLAFKILVETGETP